MNPRWHVLIVYRTAAGENPVEHDLEEIDEIDDLIERGPHWDTIIEIKIKPARHSISETLTVEQAKDL